MTRGPGVGAARLAVLPPVIALVLALALVLVDVPAPAVATAGGSGPEPRPGGRPGEIVHAEPMAVPDEAPEGSRAWRIRYRSRDLAGAAIEVSGFVVAPGGPAPRRGRPVVTWAHGTTGLGDACAPSLRDDAPSSVPWIADYLDAGYVVAATDYEGLGTPGLHPYLVGESEGRAVLDAARAAANLPTGAGRRVGVVGHSQGGHAALFAGEIARDYAPDLAVKAVAAGSPVSDVAAFLDHAVSTPGGAGFVAMGMLGYAAVYPELATTLRLPPGAADVVAFGCAPDVLAAYAAGLPFERPTGPELEARLRENTAGRRRTRAPVLVWQGGADPLTPEAINATYGPRACAQGTRVLYRVYPDANHGSVLVDARPDVLAFLATRFAGGQVGDTCPAPDPAPEGARGADRPAARR